MPDYGVAQFEAMRLEIACLQRTVAEQRAEIERLHNGIAEVERIVASNEATIDLDRHSNRWYVFTPRGECNDDRHADTLLDLIRKLGGSTDDQRTASDTAGS